MLSQMLSICFFVLWMNSIESQEMCSFVKPKGTYEGLGVYKWYPNVDDGEYYFYNRNGTEWKLDFKPDINGISHKLELFANKTRTFNAKITKRFGMYSYGKGQNEATYANCEIYTWDPASVNCTGKLSEKSSKISNEYVTLTLYETLKSLDPADNLVFRPLAVGKDMENYALFINKRNRNKFYFSLKNGEISQHLGCNDCKDPFIKQMNDSLLRQLDGVVGFNYELPLNGFLLLFNIENRPKYCYTFEGQHLSESCKTVENLIPIFEECFQESVETTNETMPTDKPNNWIIIVIIIVIMVILIISIVSVWYWKCRKDSNVVSGTTLHTSETTVKSSATSIKSNIKLEIPKKTGSKKSPPKPSGLPKK